MAKIKTYADAEKVIAAYIEMRGMDADAINKWLVVGWDYADGETYTVQELHNKVDEANMFESRRVKIAPLMNIIVRMDAGAKLTLEESETLADHISRNIASRLESFM